MEKIVIIGSGMSGGKLTEELISLNKDNFDITIIGEESVGNYDRIKLSYLLKDEEPDNFWLNTDNWYKKNNVKSILNEKVIEIDRNSKKVTTNKGTSVQYDKLVIAAGSNAFVPKIEGIENSNVSVLRNLKDTEYIKKQIKDKSKVLVIGGGLLGLELAYTLYELGKEVTVSHLMDSLMEIQLNKEAGKYLKRQFETLGINFIMNTAAVKITESQDSIQVKFKDNTEIDTDFIILNCGIVPSIELAHNAGLKTNRGIIVNDSLQTTDENIYSVGECIEYNNTTYGIIAPIYEQVRTLARILNNEEVTYKNSILPPTKLKSKIAAVSMGKIQEDENDEVIYYNNPKTQILKKIITKDNKIIGAHVVGEDLNSDAIGVYYTANLPLPNRMEQLLFPGVHKPDTPSLAVYWPNDIIICDCNGITCETIRKAVKTHRNDIDQVMRESKAGTSCGSCRNRIESIINNTYDAIVVGAGLGGLTTAATMAKKGKKVLIIEKHDKVGGYATKFTREDYSFDVSLHNFGPYTDIIKEIFDDLEIDKKLEYIPYDNFQRVIFPENDINIPTGIDNLIKLLIELYPSEKDGIKKIFEQMKKIREGLDLFEKMGMSGDPSEMNSELIAEQYPEFLTMLDITYQEFINKYITDDKLKGVIGNFWWYLGLPPSQVASLIYSVTSINYFGHGGGYIKGSSQNLSDALADVVISNHGRVILNTKVTKILLADKKAQGVLTEEGEIFYSDIVISNINATDTFINLVDEDQTKKRIRRKVSEMDYSLSAIQLYLGLDCDPETLGFKDHCFTVFTSYDHDENLKFIIDGQYEKSFFSCTNYTKVDKESTPEGKGTISIYSVDHIKNWENLSEYEYRKKKEEVTEIFIKKAEKYLPGLSKHIAVKELGTPKTMFRYTFNPEGSIYGPSHITEQSGMRRLPTFTSNPGLFIVGSTIYPGGGYPSVISSGYKTAKMILFAEKKLKEESESSS